MERRMRRKKKEKEIINDKLSYMCMQPYAFINNKYVMYVTSSVCLSCI